MSADTVTPTGVQVGVGVKTASVHKEFTQGSSRPTGNSFDVMINGEGFFSLQKENGEIVYSRDGSLKADAQGRMMSTNGYLLTPPITIPPGTVNVAISALGVVNAKDSQGKVSQIGQIEIVNFMNPSGLLAMGGNAYQASEASGAPTQGVPGNNGMGTLEQGQLETSNVNIVTEMVNMIQAQRAYEMNSKVMQAADQMLQVSNNVVK